MCRSFVHCLNQNLLLPLRKRDNPRNLRFAKLVRIPSTSVFAGMAKLRDRGIIFNIIVRLPVKSILRFRCVSKAWCKLLKDPNFVKRHLSHAKEMNKFSVMMLSFSSRFGSDGHTNTYTLGYDPLLSTLSNPVLINYPWRYKASGIRFWGTCNGLICGSPRGENCVFLWNPATKEFKEVPTVPGDEPDWHDFAFGYDDKIDDFKVVSFAGFDHESCCEVEVYTLKTNSWRRLGDIPYEFCPSDFQKDQATVNGVTHWFGLTDSMTQKVISSFDFKDESFNKMQLPSFCNDYAGTWLCSFGGSLCLHGSVDGRTDVWEMKEYGVTGSWAKLFTFKHDTILQVKLSVPLQFVKNSEVLLGYDTDVGYHLDLHDIKRGTSINIKVQPKRDSYGATTFVYLESLVNLNSGTYVAEPELPRWASARTIVLNSINSGALVGGVGQGDSEDDDESEEDEETKGLTKEFPASPKSVNGAKESPEKSCEILDKYNCYVENYMDLKRRKVDLETKKLNLETRKLNFEIRAQEDRHMSMDISKMHAIQLNWWQMCANEITEKHRVSGMSFGNINGDKEEDEDCNDVELEEDIQGTKKKAKMM